MKKVLKLICRIIIVVFFSIFIFSIIDKVLKIKHSDKIITDTSWDWTDENEVYFSLLNDKYYRESSDDDYLLMQMKNTSISKKEKNEKRILVVGDSFVWGYSGTNVNYTWWKQLNLRIKEEGYSNVNVYAAGRHGLNTKEELELILNNDKLMDKIDPDLVIIGYVPNDPEEHDEDGNVLIDTDFNYDETQNPIYKKNPTLYYELIDRLYALDLDDYEQLIELGNVLGIHRWDARFLYLVEGERLQRYCGELKDLNERMKQLEIPYFYAISNNYDNKLVDEAIEIVVSEMEKLNVSYFSPKHNYPKLAESMNITDYRMFNVNPGDSHPGIAWTYYYSNLVFEELKENYDFVFEDAVIDNMDKLEININDTMPFFDIKKIDKNVYEFVYPKFEGNKTKDTQFLYYPLEKDYVKLNLEYPKNVKRIKITGENLKSAEIYVNTINEKYGFDYDEAFKKLTPCKYILNNTYSVNKKITSVNIHAIFKDEKDRTLRIEFIE